MKWQVIFKSIYTGGYLVVVLEASSLSEIVKRMSDRDVISITRIMDE